MLELLTLFGSAGAGKLFQIGSEVLTNASVAKQEKEEREFQRSMADKGQLKEYLESVHKLDDGKPTMFSTTLCILYIMFGATACAACLYCFYLGVNGQAHIKDPDTEGTAFKFFILEWQFQARNISSLSPMGVGYLILHPILFILSTVSGSTRSHRR